MKKIIKLAAAFAVSGAMLATVGCQQIYEDIDDINAEIEQIEKTDLVTLRSRIETCVAEIERVEAAYKTDDATLKAEIENAYKEADEALLESAKTLDNELKEEYTQKINELKDQLDAAVKDLAKATELSALSNSVDTAKTNLRAADAKLAGDIITALQTCENARALLKSEVTTALNDSTAKYALIIAGIQSDVADNYAELLGKINAQSAELNRVKDKLAAADSTNAADLKAAKTALEKAVADAKTALQTAIDKAIAGVDPRVDSLAGVTLQIVTDLAALETLVKDFETAVYAKIKADSTAANSKIDAIKTEYLNKYAELADIDQDIQYTLDSLKGVYDTRIGKLETDCGTLTTSINELKTDYNSKVAQFELELKKLNHADTAAMERIDTLVAGVYARISAVNDDLRDSIAKTLVDAKAYTDTQIDALKLDEKLTGVRKDFADSIKAIREDYIKQVDSIDAKYKEIVDKLVAKIQSIVAVPSAEYQITYYDLSGFIIGDAKICASFEVLPKEAAAKITKANAQLHIKLAYASSSRLADCGDELAAIDTVLTGNALSTVKTDKNTGLVTIEAVLPIKKDPASGEPVYAHYNMKNFFSLGVSDFAATYNEIQSEYVAATSKVYYLLDNLGWYCGDTLVTSNGGAVVDTAANSHCYIEGAQNFGTNATLKFTADFADGEKTKTVDKLRAYLGDSLYVTYDIISDGNIEFALQDSTDATNAAAFKAIPDASTRDNPSIGSHFIVATPHLKNNHGLDIELDWLKWSANYTVTKYEYNTSGTSSNGWALNKGTATPDYTIYSLTKADSTYFAFNELGSMSKTSNAVLVNNFQEVTSQGIKYVYTTKEFADKVVKDTVTLSYDNGTNYGKVTLYIETGIAPVLKGTDSIAAFDAATDSIKLNFNGVVPYIAGQVDSTWTGFPANHDSVVFKTISGKTVLGDSAQIVNLQNTNYTAVALMQNSYKLNYNTTYEDTLKVAVTGQSNIANFTYEFPFSVKTIECPFKVISTLAADSVVVGKLKKEGGLKYHMDTIDVSEFFEVVYSKDSTLYTGDEPVKVVVSCGKDSTTVVATNGILAAVEFPADSLIKYQYCYASTQYRDCNNDEKVTASFKEKSPLTQFSIKADTLTKVRPLANADTIKVDGTVGTIKLEASDTTITNAWDLLKWEPAGEDFVGTLECIDSTDVTFKYSLRTVKIDGYVQNEPSFKMTLDPATQKPVIVIGEEAQGAEYLITIPYVANKHFTQDKVSGNVIFRFKKN